jgi:hypothetical protein
MQINMQRIPEKPCHSMFANWQFLGNGLQTREIKLTNTRYYCNEQAMMHKSGDCR